MHRLEFFLGTVLLSWTLSCGYPECVKAQPNIILIVADDLGERDLAVYGNPFIETPNLDRLAETGALATQGYSSAPICSPTRASILTGSAPARIGMTEHLRGVPPVPNTQEEIPPENVRRIPDSFPILSEILSDIGYTSAHIGKIHFGASPAEYDYDLVFSGGSLPNTYYFPFFNGNPFPELTSYADEGDFLTDVLTDRSIDFIEEQAENGPFFLHLNYYAPHVPIEGREDLVAKYTEKAASDPDHVLPEPEYAAMVEGIDENVGRLVARLEALDLLQNTLVIFTSDNGALHVEEVPQFAAFTPPVDNYPLRAGKGHLYEGGTRVPFLFTGLDVTPGLIIRTPIISADLFTTIVRLAGSDMRGYDGQDISPALTGGSIPERFLYQHFPHYSPQRGKPLSSIVADSFKLVKWAERDTIELFNLVNDPSESCNLALSRPALADSLEHALEQWLASVRARRTTPNPNYDARPVRARESFDHRLDTKLESRNNGSGWVYNWVKTSGPSLEVAEGALSGGPVEPTGGFLPLVSNSDETTRYLRQFLNPFTDVNTLWCSFLIQHDAVGAFSHNWLDPEGQEIFSVRKEAADTDFSLANIGSGAATPFALPGGDPHWLVIRLTSNSEGDSVALWIDPPFDTLPDIARADAILSGIDLSNGIGAIGLSIAEQFSGAIDEWKLDFGYQGISPPFVPDFPPYSLHEPFTYTIGASPVGKGADTLGWNGAWFSTGSDPGNSVLVKENNLRLEDDTGDAPAHVEMSYSTENTRLRIDRTLDAPILSDGSTYWISYWVQTQQTNATANVANLNLVNSAIANADGHRLTIGRLYGTGQIGLITPINGARSNSTVSDRGLRHLLIRIRTTNQSEDSVHLWINPGLEDEPSIDDARAFLITDALKAGADRIRLRVEGAGQGQVPLTVAFDHIRIGRSWEIARLFDEDIASSAVEVTGTDPALVQIYPVPASNRVRLDMNRPGDYTLQFFTTDGRLIDARNVDFGPGRSVQDLDVSKFEPGVYVLLLDDSSTSWSYSTRILIHR